jgi:hypothetical protein
MPSDGEQKFPILTCHCVLVRQDISSCLIPPFSNTLQNSASLTLIPPALGPPDAAGYLHHSLSCPNSSFTLRQTLNSTYLERLSDPQTPDISIFFDFLKKLLLHPIV